MKKFIIGICAIIMMFSLVGCNEKVANNGNNIVNNVNSGENDINNESSGEEKNNLLDSGEVIVNTEISDYKLLDEYNEDIVYAGYYNFFNVAYSTYELEESFYNDNYIFESDGKEYVLSTKRPKEETRVIELLINGEKFELDYGGISAVAVIDIDPTDNSKEIVLQVCSDGFNTNVLYKIDSDGKLVEYLDSNKFIEKELCYINGKFIIPVYLVNKYAKPIIIGYYAYTDGEFKYIDRCLTGEKSTEENGYLIKEIQDEIFYCDGALHYIEKDKKSTTNKDKSTKFKILKVKIDFNEQTNEYEKKYDVELLEDTEWGDDKTTEILPKGTVLEDVNYTYLVC